MASPSAGQLETASAPSTNGHQPAYPVLMSHLMKPNLTVTQAWLVVDRRAKTVTIRLSLPLNNLSLNGYSHGFAELDVPLGWRVRVVFHNHNRVVAGGLMVVHPQDIVRGTNATPALRGAAMPDIVTGIQAGQSAIFEFTAVRSGNYVLESALTASSGSWIWFVVTAANGQPVVKTRVST